MDDQTRRPQPLHPHHEEIEKHLTDRAAKMDANIGGECAARQTARAAILERAQGMRRFASRLEALARSIPDNYPRDADEALYEIISAWPPR
jgi:hypothetical protein